jgi:flagellar hook assembly protein FlgD
VNAGDIIQVALAATPSPARGRAELRFALPQAGQALLEVLDVEGRVVRVLARGEFTRGAHALTWDGRDDSGSRVAGGIYIYRLVTAAGTVARKAVVLR